MQNLKSLITKYFILVLLPASALANEVYVLGGLGLVQRNLWNYQWQASDEANNQPGSGFFNVPQTEKANQFGVGWAFSPNWAVELGCNHMGSKDFTYTKYRLNSPVRTAQIANRADALTLAVKTFITTEQSFRPYLKIGLSRMRVRDLWEGYTSYDTQYGTRLYWSVGVERAFTDRPLSAYAEVSGFGRVGSQSYNAWSAGEDSAAVGNNPVSLLLGLKYHWSLN